MFAAIVPAAGKGTRMRSISVPSKQLLPLGGIPAVVHTLRALDVPEIAAVVLVVPREQLDVFSVLTKKYNCGKVKWVIPGGDSRQESVRLGLKALPPEYTHVLIHDGGRPLVTRDAILGCIQGALETGAATVAVPVKDTIKSSLDGRYVDETLRRELLWQIQTPQAFLREALEKWHDDAARSGLEVTDDAALAEANGCRVRLVMGEYSNLKLTTPEDLVVAEALLHYAGGESLSHFVPKQGFVPEQNFAREQFAQEQEVSCWSVGGKTVPEQAIDVTRFRTGVGYDVHRLGPGRKLVLGGVEVPYDLGLVGHSDADVALHALMDALLGAAGLGDIGRHFPDTDPKYEGCSSLGLLEVVIEMLSEKGYCVANADITIVAERPKLAPYIAQMQETTASACRVPVERINYKATTTEGLGFTGEGRGIAAYAVCLLAAQPETT